MSISTTEKFDAPQ